MALHHVQVLNNLLLKPLAAHMISNHWEDSWTIRIENTPQEFKLAMKGTKNQV